MPAMMKGRGVSPSSVGSVYSGLLSKFESIQWSTEIDLKVAGTTLIVLPGTPFFVTECGIVCSAYAAITVQPTVSWGVTGDHDKHVLGRQLTLMSAVGNREIFNVLQTDVGEATSLAFEIYTGATGTTLMGYAYWKGIIRP